MRETSVSHILVAVLVFAALTACSGFDQGVTAYDKGDYGAALREWERLADDGHPKAQYNLALLYYHGRGVPRNLGEAVRLTKLSAEQGYPLALYAVGVMHSRGEGLLKDDEQAAHWIAMAAEHGLPEAMHDLASLYGEGRGLERDPVQALKWYLLAIPKLKGEPRRFAEDNLQTLIALVAPDDIRLARELAMAWEPKTWLDPAANP